MGRPVLIYPVSFFNGFEQNQIKPGGALMSIEARERSAGSEKQAFSRDEMAEILSRIFETNRDAVFISDSDGFVRLINRKAEQYFNAPAEQILGRKMLIPHKNGESREIHISRPDKDLGIAQINSFEITLSSHETYYVSTLREVTELVRIREEMRSLTLVDNLVDLCNRRGFLLLAQQQLKLASRKKKGLYLFMIGIDNYKKTAKDAEQHLNNRLITGFSKVMKDTFRKSDILARISEDTFAALAVEAELNSSDKIATRLLNALESYNAGIQKEAGKVLASMGIAYYYPERHCSYDELVAQADMLLYKNRVNRKKSALSWYMEKEAGGEAKLD
jgi:diguanylate cyclase (GGDEF)-like protein/PAS domain S-box-containing protein